ncbi:transferrin-like [Tribolium madens]|uniref:transferrin-like n=1 Tax=Tribolium madens TaxID=41895 RepID=UPI001CF72C20|nr:transferrin-like [Tribolium madens]
MWSLNITLLLLLIIFSTSCSSQEINKKICSTTPDSSSCQQIARDLEVACNYNKHSVDCLLNIQSNKTHLGKITGDEALLGAGADLLSEDVVVLGKITSHHPSSETVVIIKSDVAPNIASLEGKSLCHPGYKHDSSFSHSMLQELENKIIEINPPECRDDVTLLERHIKKLSEFFGASCRPGPWTQNDEFDKTLKTKYPSLCKLCTTETCEENYSQPFNDSLKCLLKKNADVAVSTLQEAQLFFANSDNSNKYKYLCKDGSVRSSDSHCTWTKKLPDLIVANRLLAGEMKKYLQNNLGSHITYNLTQANTFKSNFEEDLVVLLELQYGRKITFLENNGFLSLKNYVNDFTTVPDAKTFKQCDRTLKWCTFSNVETEKCKWLSQAAVNWGIQPVVECIRSDGDDELSCLDDIKKGDADIVVASSDYAYISLKKGLTSVAFPETDTRNLSQIFIVKRVDDASIKSFSDLKGKSACIPQFGGKEHLALIDTTRRLGITDKTECDYGQVLNNFIGDSCVPGVRSSLIKESTECVDKDKMCKQCRSVNVTKTAEYCNADEINAYFGSQGSVNCLLMNYGDFAVVSKKSVLNDTNLRALCKNNSLAATNGLDVDDDCALVVLASSEVVLKNDTNKKSDIQLALYEFERWFGQNPKKPFHLFDKFDNKPDLLFLDSTPGLNFEGNLHYIKEYKELLDNVLKCNTSAAPNMTFSTSFIISFFLLTLCFTF